MKEKYIYVIFSRYLREEQGDEAIGTAFESREEAEKFVKKMNSETSDFKYHSKTITLY